MPSHPALARYTITRKPWTVEILSTLNPKHSTLNYTWKGNNENNFNWEHGFIVKLRHCVPVKKIF